MAKKERYTVEQVCEAIRSQKGLLSMAANRLGCSYMTVWNYSQKYPEVKQAIEESKESMLDLAEGKLFQEINAGNMTAIIFFLKTKGKARGYSERQEITGAEGGPVMGRVVVVDSQECKDMLEQVRAGK